MTKGTKRWIGLLSLPALFGFLSWIGSWLNPKKGSATLILEAVFVICLWVGVITSTAALIITHKIMSRNWESIASYLLNGIWLATSLLLIGFYCYVKSK